MNELRHYGVPGMKWGRRKAQIQSTPSSKNTRKQLEKEYGKLENQMTYGKKANAKRNAQIQKRMTSIENKLNELSKQERAKKAEKGKKILPKLMSSAAFVGTGLGVNNLGFGF